MQSRRSSDKEFLDGSPRQTTFPLSYHSAAGKVVKHRGNFVANYCTVHIAQCTVGDTYVLFHVSQDFVYCMHNNVIRDTEHERAFVNVTMRFGWKNKHPLTLKASCVSRGARPRGADLRHPLRRTVVMWPKYYCCLLYILKVPPMFDVKKIIII